MKHKKWILLSSIICLIFVFAGWVSWTLFSSGNSAEPINSNTSSNPGTKIEEKSEDFSEEIVNKPVKEEIVVFSESDFENGHDFIEVFHDFYNTTLCWERVETADYKDQQEKALRIVEAFKGIKIKDKRLSEDFISIENTAKQVIESEDRDAMIKLHRLFHDLDIYFNGYSKDDTFGVTEYKGVRVI
ncbi:MULTISPECIES: hypothetical protein [Metabacillus]|uniref:Uncharacterized protein n=2 Tax=Metabacillus TaxID=2675233 RepID=A0A179T267_9BACI|nr:MULTISPECIES: hypothetical protein [Metabacillus]OAS86603.1 hypothetical protein A6K24_03580 [Metabacillus litoralis]QNF29324.1 hypothetical protein HUW50_18645 [Metabacillus sp. KUDC1714]